MISLFYSIIELSPFSIENEVYNNEYGANKFMVTPLCSYEQTDEYYDINANDRLKVCASNILPYHYQLSLYIVNKFQSNRDGSLQPCDSITRDDNSIKYQSSRLRGFSREDDNFPNNIHSLTIHTYDDYAWVKNVCVISLCMYFHFYLSVALYFIVIYPCHGS